MAGFEYRGQLNGADNPVTIDMPIAASATVKVGDLVYIASAGVTRASATTSIMGVVAGIVDNNGIDLDNTNSSNYDGTWTSSSKTYVATSDNLTDKKVRAKVIADNQALFYNDADGDFTNPTDLGKMVNCADQDQVDEDTHADDLRQLQIMKLDPDGDGDASKVIVRIAYWQGALGNYTG